MVSYLYRARSSRGNPRSLRLASSLLEELSRTFSELVVTSDQWLPRRKIRGIQKDSEQKAAT